MSSHTVLFRLSLADDSFPPPEKKRHREGGIGPFLQSSPALRAFNPELGDAVIMIVEC